VISLVSPVFPAKSNSNYDMKKTKEEDKGVKEKKLCDLCAFVG
jgi:hypothetical protein